MTKEFMYELIADVVVGVIGFVFLSIIILHLILLRKKNTNQDTTEKNKIFKIILGAFLGIIPGCGGAISSVILYKKKKISFGALSASFITTLGEGTFVLLFLENGKYIKELLIITLILLIIAIITGIIIDYFKISPESISYVQYLIITFQKYF